MSSRGRGPFLCDGATGSAAVIAALATALDMETTAEGVEEEGQMAVLRGQGCTTIQGYLISRPIAGDQVAVMLGEEQARRAA